MFNFGDEFFKKIEKKTNISKETILGLANKLQHENFKDEKTLRNLIKELSALTGKPVSKEKEDKIIQTILHDKIPKDLNKMVD